MSNPVTPNSAANSSIPDQLADLADLIFNVSQELKSLPPEPDTVPLTLTESNVMRFIDRNPGTSPSRLAHGTGVQRTNMSAALKGLEEKGLVRRVQTGDDGRSVKVEPTPNAARNLEKLRRGWSSGMIAALDNDPSGYAEALVFLRRLESGLLTARQHR